MNRVIPFAIAFCAVAVAMVACVAPVDPGVSTCKPPVESTQVSTSGPSANIPTPVSTNSVGISGGRFVPQAIEVAAGSTVTWTNQDKDVHSIQSRGNLFNSPVLKAGDTFNCRFDYKGSFDYYDKAGLQFNPAPYYGTVVVK